MSAPVPTSAVGLTQGSTAKAVQPVQEYLRRTATSRARCRRSHVDDVYVRSGAPDHVLGEPLAAQDGVLDDATVEVNPPLPGVQPPRGDRRARQRHRREDEHPSAAGTRTPPRRTPTMAPSSSPAGGSGLDQPHLLVPELHR